MDQYEIDGIILYLDGAHLVMQFALDGQIHRFRFMLINAVKIAESILKLTMGKKAT